MGASEIESEIDAIAADFALLADWEERYAHLIELGRGLAPFAPAERNEASRVRGCASQVWLICEPQGDRLTFRGDSDAHLVRGLIALLLRVFSGRRAEDIVAADPRAMFDRLGLGEALTAQRSNGFRAMIQRIRDHAGAAKP